MIKKNIKGKTYKLPGSLTSFQEEMYIHLINWKWQNITKDVGIYNFKGNQIEYDAILPKSVQNKYPLIYPKILQDLKDHRKKYYFKFHQHFNHMASSQAANVNLFLPLLLHLKANKVFSLLKPDFKSLAIGELYKGFRIEFWDGNSNEDRGLLKDHSSLSGTDSDIAIAYYNQKDELCLWLIEHKLTEKEFTECGGFKSKDRDKAKHLCEKNFSEIISNKNLCFHHSFKDREYWNLTDENRLFFVNYSKHNSCPFKGGMNQLWRNQLMGFALEKVGMFKEVYFSVVKHPENKALDKSIDYYKDLINHNNRFSVFDSKEVIEKVAKLNDSDLNDWLIWYKELYKINN
ncbi:hypothetical protein SDC9_55346 [bioreactor metagenome]|uniref:Uncharacterized protein n=1 Tax=bioreactor metagenome TaxID=1076179 RepID=A0A644WYN7_9ZZZZ